MRTPKKVRLVDVARAAGVSVTTVSEALNGIPGVSENTRERVRAIAAELRYSPNRAAQNLVGNRSNTVGIVFSGPSTLQWLSNPVFIEFLRPIVMTLSRHRIHVLTEIATVDTESERVIGLAQGGGVDVIILIGTRRKDAELEELLSSLPVPVITMVRHPLPGSRLGVAVDNHAIGRLAARHLISQGHRRLGYIGSLPGVGLASDRLRGFRAECRSAGISMPARQVVSADFYQPSGRTGMRWLLANTDVTAVFCGNDLMAIGALQACVEEGVRVPDEISLLGCDGIPNLDLLAVPLTTISMPTDEMGVAAAEQAAAVVSGAPAETLQPRTFPAELVVRASTSAPPAGGRIGG